VRRRGPPRVEDQQEKLVGGFAPQLLLHIVSASRQATRQGPILPSQKLLHCRNLALQLLSQASYALIAVQVWVAPQQVTEPEAEEQVPLATVQVSVPPVQVAVQVSVAAAHRGPAEIAKATNATSPTIKTALRMSFSL
jgi:hypothetical protein